MPEISPARPEEIPRLIELLDDEFMARRHRTGSVAAHYRDLFQPANSPHLLVLRHENVPVSFCAIQPIRIHRGSKVFNGGLIGFVYTHPAHRGHGWAGQLLTEAASLIEARNLDFAALFTTLDGFYERLGWTREDQGLFGSVATNGGAQPLGLAAHDPAKPGLIETIDAIRQRYETLWVERSSATYRRYGLGVEHVRVLFTPEHDAYALVGTHGGIGYLYELCGTEANCELIWSSLIQSYRQLSINTHAEAAALPWLAQRPGLLLQPQRLALWKWFVSQPSAPRNALNHIPYFDRI